MPITNDMANTVTALRVASKRKLDHLAKFERRSIIETTDIIIDEALVRRGIDPAKLGQKRSRKK